MMRASRGEGGILHFRCPGCEDTHRVNTGDEWGPGNAWTWNGDLELPTFAPSVLVRGHQWDTSSGFHKPTHRVEPGEQTICHSFVTDGRIQFLADCTHELAGQTVDLPEWRP